MPDALPRAPGPLIPCHTMWLKFNPSQSVKCGPSCNVPGDIAPSPASAVEEVNINFVTFCQGYFVAVADKNLKL